MRLVIDLLSLQNGAARAPEAALASAQALVRQSQGQGNDVLVTLSAAWPQRIDALRAAFDGLLPPEQIRVYAQPGGDGAWSQQAAALVREAYLAGLQADSVFEPGLHELPQPVAPVAAAPADAAAARPRLAYISPLPPEHSGIADYSVELIAELTQYYEIELIAAPGVKPLLGASYPVRSVAEFEQNAHRYQRILYHFGNSNPHQHMFGLLQRHPGVVVLHDFFLSGVLDNMERDGVQAQAFLEALYASHGHSGLLTHQEQGRNAAIWAYPCNKPVLDAADGVIVHAEFSRELAERWYGPGSAELWRVLPLLRGLPADAAEPAQARSAARAALNIAADSFLVCTFGMLGATKLNHRLLDAFLASPLAQDERCHLVFVGENDAGPYGIELRNKINASPAAARIRITGFADHADYVRYLDAADTAVQLRTQTRGETSASVLDCLLHGLPTIINAHGAAANLPDQVLVKLADAFSDDQLSAALATLHADAARRAALADAGRSFVKEHHAPAAVGRQYRDALEHFAVHSPNARYRSLLRQLARIAAPAPSEAAAISAASAIAANLPAQPPRQLLVDISALVQTDPKTGIQRVVRAVLRALIETPPAGYRIEPVFSQGANLRYRYARKFTAKMLGVAAPQLEDAPIETRAGDLFLGLDLATNITTQNLPQLQQMRQQGVQLWYVLYDLLPLLRPDAFPFGAQKYYGDYVEAISTVADGVVAISAAVRDELHTWLSTRPNRRSTPLQLGYFHLGADLATSTPSRGLPPNVAIVEQALRTAPTLLMVGTLEPRKGQAQALAACELLWQQGVAVNLVIVGKNGWMVDDLAKKLEAHPQRERQLFWLPGVSDEMLELLYANSSALLAASEGEGFGLPLIESAQHGLPIIARALPVFKEVAGEHAYYFEGTTPEALAQALNDWLDLHAAGKAPPSNNMPWLTWRQAAVQLTDCVLGGHNLTRYNGGDVAPQLLVDVSAIVRDDLKTGIQRVVRAQLAQLLRTPTSRYQARPIYLSNDGGQWHYRYARNYEHELMGIAAAGVRDDVVQVGAGDVYYSPDFFPEGVNQAARAGLYARWRQEGVSINFLVHDLLPVLKPEFFPPQAGVPFAAWLTTIAAQADRLVCISAAVADELAAWLAANVPQRQLPQLAVVHHGADLDASSPSKGLPGDARKLLDSLAVTPGFLSVGTIEPRKGHLHMLDAFDQLWAQGVDAQLVIVGSEGWTGLPAAQRRTIPAIVQRINKHPELGRRLHWLRGVSDEYLEALYGASACLLVPSEGEGFGLPLIEAARHDLPLIARDIPVFREVAGEHAAYFSGDGAALAAAVSAWLQQRAQGSVTGSGQMPWRTWAQNVADLGDILFHPKV
jgi:glycosyltransferase involved in cell wall biosynthesis